MDQCCFAWDLNSPDWHECALDRGHDGDHECCAAVGGAWPHEPSARECAVVGCTRPSGSTPACAEHFAAIEADVERDHKSTEQESHDSTTKGEQK